jgi:hypothetical protein
LTLRLKVGACGLTLPIQRRELMSLDNRSAILQKQVLNTHKNPQIFLFESSEREDDIVLVRPAAKAIFSKNLLVSKHDFFMAHENGPLYCRLRYVQSRYREVHMNLGKHFRVGVCAFTGELD